MGFESTLSIIVAVIVVACNCEPDPQYLVSPYQYGVHGALARSPLTPVGPRTFAFTSIIKPLFTYTYSTTTTSTTITTTTTATCTVSDSTLSACSRRRRGLQIAEESMTDNDNWFLLPSAPHSVKRYTMNSKPFFPSE